MKYIVALRIRDFDTTVHTFDSLQDALKCYWDELEYGSNPVLAQVLDVKISVTDIDNNVVEKVHEHS
jgi:hypothetical protein